MKTATPASAASAACTATAAEPLRSTPPTARVDTRPAPQTPPLTAAEPLRSTPRTAGLDSRPVTESAAVTARNHTPIIWLAYLAGAIFVVTDRPTGERHSSPTVMKK